MADRSLAPGALLPQRMDSAREVRHAADWLFEPFWPGQRLLAFVDAGRVRLTDPAGERVEAAFPEAVRALSAAVDADQAVVDGIWTTEPPGAPPGEADPRFIAVDLLELEREPLLDVPLLERRRLLESVVASGERIRVSQVVRQPIGSWLVAWRALGFTAYIAKHANSRYLPGEVNAEWLRLSAERVRPPSMAERLMWQPRIPERRRGR